MKLYMNPGSCSLAAHIALHEAGRPPELVTVDILARKPDADDAFARINPKGYVPALVLDDGEILTENVAVLDWIAQQAPDLVPAGAMGRTRMMETNAFLASEVQKPFIRSFFAASDAETALCRSTLSRRFGHLAGQLRGDWLFGDRFSAADPYLYVMLRWAEMIKLAVPAGLTAFRSRVEARPAVQAALRAEGLA